MIDIKVEKLNGIKWETTNHIKETQETAVNKIARACLILTNSTKVKLLKGDFDAHCCDVCITHKNIGYRYTYYGVNLNGLGY